MKTIILIVLIGLNISTYSQDKENDFFVFYKGGKKYLKPIKYLLFNPKEDKKKETNKSEIYFYIKNERYKFSKKNHKTDTCNVKYLKKIVLAKAKKLANEEFEFREEKLKEDKSLKNKLPVPLTKLHQYFRVFIIVKNLKEIIKYEVDWEYSHSYK